jgi:LCP family protein required for cell wall assembly
MDEIREPAQPEANPDLERRGHGGRRKRRRAQGGDALSRRVVKISALSLVTLTAASAVGLGALYKHLDNNIKTVDVSSAAGTNAPVKVSEGALNILLIGSDSRAGTNAEYGTDSGARSDTTMLLHVSKDRKTATVASIPRDSMVQIPSCDLGNGKTSAATLGMFNSAFATGGAACTVKTVQSISGIAIDHVMVVDFTGFKDIVDAIGGVQVTLDKAVNDPASHLDLPAGTSTITGEQALAYVRARETLGDGSDIGRMSRQQEFMKSVLDKMTSDGVLNDPAKLVKVLDAATKSLTTDPALGSLSALTSLADDLKTVPKSGVTYLTVPWQSYAPDPNRVELAPTAQTLFASMLDDTPLPTSLTTTTTGASS